MNKKRVLSLALTAAVLVGIAAFAFYRYDSSKRFPYSQKNSFAMGTIVSQKAYAPYGSKHIEKVNLLISSLENVISRNKELSEISKLNSQGVASDKDIAEIVRVCKELSELSSGAFDITIGRIVDLWAFGKEDEGIPEKTEIEKALSLAGNDKLTLDGEKITLSTGAEIDLGAVGKGIACDAAIAYYKAIDDCEGAIISVGGSIGCFGRYNKQGDKWRIAVRHPRQDNSFLGVISLDEGYVSTSGDYEKYFIENDVRYHHILDARTGYPASCGLISVTVVCDSGFLSDALSTVCFILGKDESKSILEKYNASAIFVDENMEISTVGEIDFEKQ